ncbi:hypothetical protein ACFLZB_03625 [Nanoarchaeota archaeon]
MNLFLPSSPKKCPNCGSLLSFGIFGVEEEKMEKCSVCGVKLD